MRLIYFSVNQKCQNSTGANLKMLRPIETKYAGRRFRSRREARWAILFDHLEIDWRYEPEGYQLSGGVNYLPDFELHLSGGSRIWVEVKPELSPYDPLQRLVHESRRLGVLVAEPTLRTDVLVLDASFPTYWERESACRWLSRISGRDSLSCQAASNAALSARWEFGEQPRRPAKAGGRGPRAYMRAEALLQGRSGVGSTSWGW